MPKRIQRKRMKGWRMPPNAIYVGRPTRWGNPFHVEEGGKIWIIRGSDRTLRFKSAESAHGCAKVLFLGHAALRLRENPHWLDELRGKDLCCWCPLDQPCHADVLLWLQTRLFDRGRNCVFEILAGDYCMRGP